MTQANIDRMAAQALQRLNHFINRCSAQQIRRMCATWSKPA